MNPLKYINQVKTLALVALLLRLAQLPAAEVADLRCEYRTHPLGIDETQPQLSWVITERSQ